MSDTIDAPAPGESFLGKYVIEGVLGQGGMGVVMKARHVQLDELVAIKLIPMESEAAGQRFVREAKAASKIKSEHVARVFDVGVTEKLQPYIVMEFLEGRDLAVEVETNGPLPVSAAADHVIQACEALAEAHAAGIVHRDLKPANLFLARRADGSSCVKVLDFGISRFDTIGKITQTSSIVGSPLYMSPEQMASAKSADRRSDVWSLGIVLYELTSGRMPFEGETLPELCVNVRESPPKPLDISNAPFEGVVMKCLEKDPARRFQTVGDLARALAPFGTEESLPAVRRAERISKLGEPPPPTPSQPTTPSPQAVSGDAETQAAWSAPEKGRSRGIALVVVGVGLVAIVAVVALSLKSKPEAPGNTIPSTTAPSETVISRPPIQSAVSTVPRASDVPAVSTPAATSAPLPTPTVAPSGRPHAAKKDAGVLLPDDR